MKKHSVNKKKADKHIWAEAILHSPVATLVFSLICIAVGIIFIFSQNANTPVTREEAISYSGELERYETGRNYRTLVFKDGSSYDVYPHTEGYELDESLEALERGTMLHLLINPNYDYVAEIKADDTELLNFESSQRNIASYDNGYVYIGIFMCGAGVFLIVDALLLSSHIRHEYKKKQKRSKYRIEGEDDRAIRRADYSLKSRILLAAKVEEYDISYRRRKTVNELVINGWVYDDFKGVLEFEHALTANLGGHHIEVGLDSNDYSYILFDGEKIAKKKRIV